MFRSMRLRLAPLALMPALVLASSAGAGAQQVQYLQQNRFVAAQVLAENLDLTQVSDSDVAAAPDFAPFAETANADAAADATTASILVTQDSSLSANRIDGTGSVSGQASLLQQGMATSTGDGTSQMTVTFEVTAPSVWSIVGDLGVNGPGSAQVLLEGSGGLLYIDSVQAPGNTGIAATGFLAPGDYTLDAIADASVFAATGGSALSVFAEFNFQLRIEPQVLRYCSALPNVTGAPGAIDWSGSTSIAANDLVLRADSLPPGATAIFFYGPGQSQMPFGNGILCVNGGFARFGTPVFASAAGSATQALDYNAPPALPGTLFGILPSSTWKFQVWYRDWNPGTAMFNTTDALQVTFLP